jgi:hypothetical protein
MEAYEWVIAIVAAVLAAGSCAAGGLWLWGKWRCRRAESQMDRARRTFHRRREWLEARFVSIYARRGAPRGLDCLDCDFENEVTFARDRHSGELRALVAVTISFKAVEGGGMEDNPNVGNLRAATAVFCFDGAEWSTNGDPKFNLNPAQVIEHYHHELEMVE